MDEPPVTSRKMPGRDRTSCADGRWHCGPRHLTIKLFIAVTAIVIFPIPLGCDGNRMLCRWRVPFSASKPGSSRRKRGGNERGSPVAFKRNRKVCQDRRKRSGAGWKLPPWTGPRHALSPVSRPASGWRQGRLQTSQLSKDVSLAPAEGVLDPCPCHMRSVAIFRGVVIGYAARTAA